MNIIVSILSWIGIKILESLPGKFVDWLFSKIGRKRKKEESTLVFSPYPSDCGDRPIKLGYRKPYVAEAFGGYFAGLIEDTYGFVQIDSQIDCPSTNETIHFSPTARILYELRKPKGPRLVVIEALGGMGKTSLAIKIIKCLVEQGDADFILGDSAKIEHFDPSTNQIFKLDTSFRDARSFYRRLYGQIGLPLPPSNTSIRHMIREINDQIKDYSAVIIIDNIDSIDDTSVLLGTLEPLLSRNIRAIVTTRKIIKTVATKNSEVLAVHLNPLTNLVDVQSFLRWHINHFKHKRPKLLELETDIDKKDYIEQLIKKTGGVPLILQLVLNDIETKTWTYLEHIPLIPLSSDLLDYLYKQRWDELRSLGEEGKTAQAILSYITEEQKKGKRISFADLERWAEKNDRTKNLIQALYELEARFLILNRDTKEGNFSIFPSLAEFIKKEIY